MDEFLAQVSRRGAGRRRAQLSPTDWPGDGADRSTARRYAEAAFEIAERDDSCRAWVAAFDAAERAPRRARGVRGCWPARRSRDRAARRCSIGSSASRHAGRRATSWRCSSAAAASSCCRWSRAEFRRLYRRREGIVEAVVTSAAPLDDAEVDALAERLAVTTGARVEHQPAGRSSLLGGRPGPHGRPTHRRQRPRSPRAPAHPAHRIHHLTPHPARYDAPWPSAPTTSPRSSSPPSTSSTPASRSAPSARSWRSVTASPASTASRAPSPRSCWSSPTASRAWPSTSRRRPSAPSSWATTPTSRKATPSRPPAPSWRCPSAAR